LTFAARCYASAVDAVVRSVSVTFVYCVETATDTVSCYGMWTGNHTEAFEWYQTQRPWV